MKLWSESKKPRTNMSREELIGRLLKTFSRPIEGQNNQQISTAICLKVTKNVCRFSTK